MAVILRFKFSDDIMDIITTFAKLHQYDDRHTYKEHWDIWFECNKDELSQEIDRLEEIGYKGNVEDKMYKAGRYYFRKKQINKEANKEANKIVKRTYISMDKTIIDKMDSHIISSIRTFNVEGLEYTPAIGYTDFCKTYESTLLSAERSRLSLDYSIDSYAVEDKIKKTYKNRYFIIKR